MDKFNALTTLVCVVEQNSFSRAAEQLGKTPSAVAKAIAALEEEQGIRLFERTTRRMQLTEAGRLYAQAAREALNQLKAETSLDWSFVSPPIGLAPGARSGQYRLGLDDLLPGTGDAPAGISVADLAMAIVDEIETPRHIQQRFTVAN